MKFIYSDKYHIDIGLHVFPTEKYKLIKERLIKDGIAKEKDFVESKAASDSDVLLVHTKDYVKKLKEGTLSPQEIFRLEIPCSKEAIESSWLCAGGTIEACRNALKEDVGIHIGGGFHHAYPDHAEGFCYLNDVSVAIARTMKDGLVRKACVIDCDLHQGNGTAFIFAQEPDVFTFSIHQENNYPPKEQSDLDIGLPDGADDRLYLDKLGVVSDILDRHRPELAMYLAGADPFVGDVLGGLALTKEGLIRRDSFVFSECKKRGISVCAVLAGGYASDVSDDVDIHVNMVEGAAQMFG